MTRRTAWLRKVEAIHRLQWAWSLVQRRVSRPHVLALKVACEKWLAAHPPQPNKSTKKEI